LDGDESLHVDQLWYEQRLLSDAMALRVGFLDFQTIVDGNRYANSEDKQFLNQALDNNPLLPLNIGLGAELTLRPTDWFSVISGVGDANAVLFEPGFSTAFKGPAQFVGFLEPTFHLSLPNPRGAAPLAGNYRFGMVFDPRSRTVFARPGTDPALVETRGSDYGFYLSFDQQIYRESDADDQGLGFFARYGYRHGDINQVQNFWSAGLSYEGLIPSRDRDSLGAAVYQSIPSRQLNDRVNRWAEAETGLEVFYALAVTRWLVVTPDFQYISSPGIDSSQDDVIVLGCRTRISF
jgi:carbohydrate-selective porin OprB